MALGTWDGNFGKIHSRRLNCSASAIAQALLFSSKELFFKYVLSIAQFGFLQRKIKETRVSLCFFISALPLVKRVRLQLVGMANTEIKWNVNRVRQTFIDYFVSQGHTFVPSS